MSWRRGVGGVLQGITRPSGEGDGVDRVNEGEGVVLFFKRVRVFDCGGLRGDAPRSEWARG